jgi:cyanate permease
MTIGMVLVLLTKSLSMVSAYVVVLGIGFGAAMLAMMNLFPVYFGRTNYPKIFGFIGPFGIIIGSAGAPIAGAIRDASGSYRLSFTIAALALVAGMVCLIFARPPVHPSLKTSS